MIGKKRIDRLIRYCESENINCIYVLSNSEKISKILIDKLKEYIDEKFINANTIKYCDGLSNECIVLSDGWYMSNKNKEKGFSLISGSSKIFEIGLDDF